MNKISKHIFMEDSSENVWIQSIDGHVMTVADWQKLPEEEQQRLKMMMGSGPGPEGDEGTDGARSVLEEE